MKPFIQINQYIRHPQLRVIDEDGSQAGVLNLQEALQRAQDAGLDLIVVTDKAVPPIAKIIDYQKYKYQQEKKLKSGTAKTKSTEVKEVRITPFMAENDFQNRIKRAEGFLKSGYRTKIVVKFVGRQITRKEFGQDQLNKAIERLSPLATVEQEPKWQGKLLVTQLKPKN